jgi:hypothetical protein
LSYNLTKFFWLCYNARVDWKIAPRLLEAENMRRCKLHQCQAACCLHGVWMDRAEKEIILEHRTFIASFMPEGQQDSVQWFDGQVESDEFTPSGEVHHSGVVEDEKHWGGTACVFLRSDHKCALQTAGQAAGLHPWQWKPFYCILHPLCLDEEGRITLDETEALLDEPGGCLRPASPAVPLVGTF